MKQRSLLAKKNSSKFSFTVMKKSFILFPARSFFLLLFFSFTDLHIKEYFSQAISSKQSSLLACLSTPHQTGLSFIFFFFLIPGKPAQSQVPAAGAAGCGTGPCPQLLPWLLTRWEFGEPCSHQTHLTSDLWLFFRLLLGPEPHDPQHTH